MKTSYTFQKHELEAILLKHLGIKRDVLLDLDAHDRYEVYLESEKDTPINSLLEGVTISIIDPLNII